MRRISTSLVYCLAVLGIMATAAFAGDTPEIDFEKYTLSNGLDVILHEDHTIPMVSVNVWYHVGSKNEKPGRTGFAHLFEHMMFQGSLNADGEYFEPLQKIGGRVNGSTNHDRTNYWENVPSNYLELALWMESDRMGFLLDALTQEKLDTQKDVVKNERRQGVDNQPYGRANEMILDMMFPDDHPYSWTVIGSLDDLTAASIDDVSEFFKSYYTPSNASLCIAGDFDRATVKELVENYFGNLPPGPPVERMTNWVPEIDGVKRMETEDNVELARLYYVWHTPAYYAPGDAEFDLLANALGSGKTSRMYKALVYDQQIAQNVSVYQASRQLGSTFHITVTAKPGNSLADIEEAVDAELEKILAEGITESELEQAKTTWEVYFVRNLQQVGGFGGRANLLNSYNVNLGDPGKLAWDMERYSSATVESVNEYLREYIEMDERGILHIVPHGDPVASATEFDRSTMPAAAEEPTFTPPEIQKATLSNGLELLLVEDHRLPLVQVNLQINSGWSGDKPGKFGTASLTADMLNEGTKTRTALEISDEVKRLGANLSSGSDHDASFVSLNVLKKNLDPSLDLMADILLNPTFPEEDLDRIREQRMGSIQQDSKQPSSLAFNAFMNLLYGDNHPYGQPRSGNGTEESLQAIQRDDLVNFYRANFFPNNATVVVVGDLTLSQAKQKLEKALKGWSTGTAVAAELPEPPKIDKTKIYIVDKPGAQQSYIVAGNVAMAGDNPDRVAAGVMNRVLGGQFTSRINLNLREDKGYTYGARSTFWRYDKPGPFVTYTQVQTEFTKESVFEIAKELKDVTGKRPLTEDELKDSRSGAIKGYPQAFQSIGGIAGNLMNLAQFDLPLDSWATYNERVAKVSDKEANRIAKEYIHPDKMVIVVVGDRETIEAGLTELDLGEVVVMN